MRAVKEEEKLAVLKYCETKGEEEVKYIQKAIEERHSKELIVKEAIKPAVSHVQAFKRKIMEER